MVYLDNNTNQQEVWIPRNDGVGATHKNMYTLEGVNVSISADTTTVTPSSGYYGMSAVTIDASDYAQQNYEGGFEDGYQDGFMSGSSEGYESGYTSGYTSGHTDGVNDQKALLSTTAFTENGEYVRENGWSGVSVNIDTASTYNSGYTNGYESGYTTGYTSGHTDGVSEEKAKMSAVTFTANTAVTLSDGSYSAVTVDVPQTGYTQQDLDNAFASGETVGENTIIATFSSTTATTNGQYGSTAHPLSAITVNVPQTGSSYNVELNKPFTATSEGTYTIKPSEIWSITYDDRFARRYDFTINGTIPQSFVNDTAYIIEYYDENTGEEPSVSVMIGSGNTLYLTKNNWDEDDYGDVDFYLYQGKYRLDFDDEHLDSSEFSVIQHSNKEKYDVMSAVTLNVSLVGIHLVDYVCAQEMTDYSDYTDGIRLGNVWKTNTEFRIKGIMTGNQTGNGVLTNYDGSAYAPTRWFWVYGNMYYDFNSYRIDTPFTSVSGTAFDYTISNWGVYDNLTESYVMSGTPKSYVSPGIVWLNMCVCRISSIEVKQGNDVIINGLAAYDDNNNIGLYDTVSRTMLYNSGLPMTYGSVLDPSYFSGYTDGQNSIISTFSSMTATTNGVYGSTAHPLSSITVDVQSSGRQYVEYLETDGSQIMFDLDEMLTSLDESVYFDFMPLTGNAQYDGWYIFIGSEDDSGNFGMRTCWGGYEVNGKYGYKFGNYNQYTTWWDGPDFSAGTKYECVFTSTGATINGTNYNYTADSIGTPKSISLNGGYLDGNIARCPIARYYGFKIMSGDTVVSNFRPCLDGNGVPCFYETVSETYIYASGSGSTPTYGPFLPSDDYLSGYTDGFATGYTSGFTDGYASGYTNGFYSGSTAGYIGGLESALYGAYYPIDSATNKSYCTYFPDLEEGKSIYFDIVSTSNRQANKMFGGDYSNRDEHYLMVGFDQSNSEIDFQLNANGTPTGITTNAYLTSFWSTSGSLIYNPNQRICGEISVTDTECNYGIASIGFVPYKYTVQGDFTGPYPIKFNQDFASAFTLCKIIYTDIATGEIEHYFSFDKEANEIRDWITGDIAPTYDYNGNRAYGVLESKKM